MKSKILFLMWTFCTLHKEDIENNTPLTIGKIIIAKYLTNLGNKCDRRTICKQKTTIKATINNSPVYGLLYASTLSLYSAISIPIGKQRILLYQNVGRCKAKISINIYTPIRIKDMFTSALPGWNNRHNRNTAAYITKMLFMNHNGCPDGKLNVANDNIKLFKFAEPVNTHKETSTIHMKIWRKRATIISAHGLQYIVLIMGDDG